MAAHALQQSSGCQIPQEDGSLIVCGCKKFTVSAAGQGCDIAGVTSEHPHSVTGGDRPHADRMVGAASEDVGGIGVEADAVHVLVMADENALLTNMVCNPETGGLIMSARNKVVTERSPLKIPNRLIMAFVNDHALP
jgi:hypothetical protein